jgi:hypothetical protein
MRLSVGSVCTIRLRVDVTGKAIILGILQLAGVWSGRILVLVAASRILERTEQFKPGYLADTGPLFAGSATSYAPPIDELLYVSMQLV